MTFVDKEFIKNCLKLKALNNYERFVLLAMIEGISARAARKYVGGTFHKFYKTKKILRNFVEYRILLLRNRNAIRKFLKNCLTKHQYKIFSKFMLFPIRSSGWYAKRFNLRVNNFGSCDSLIRLVERSLERVKKNINKIETSQAFVYRRFFELFIKIAFKGRFERKWKKYL